MKNKKDIGNLGENIAKKYLENMEYRIITTNFRCKQGEIDIIAVDGEEVVFVEVKTRKNMNYGYAIDSIDYKKKSHIYKASKYFVYKYKLEKFCIRFDIVEIYLKENKYILNHLKNVLW